MSLSKISFFGMSVCGTMFGSTTTTYTCRGGGVATSFARNTIVNIDLSVSDDSLVISGTIRQFGVEGPQVNTDGSLFINSSGLREKAVQRIESSTPFVKGSKGTVHLIHNTGLANRGLYVNIPKDEQVELYFSHDDSSKKVNCVQSNESLGDIRFVKSDFAGKMLFTGTGARVLFGVLEAETKGPHDVIRDGEGVTCRQRNDKAWPTCEIHYDKTGIIDLFKIP